MHGRPWILAALVGCGVQAPPPKRARAEARAAHTPGQLAVDPARMPDASPRQDGGDGPAIERSAKASEEGPHTIVLVVLDTVRADRTSLCGHDRPTSPTLVGLARRPGAVSTCEAVTPGTWTIPSHASMFTGLEPPAHRLLRKGLSLDESLPTVAEDLHARGYRTALVSANPVLKQATGLQRGFDSADLPERLVSPYRGPALGEAVRRRIAEAAGQPLFLFVNIFDAHDPYPPVPEGHPFLPPQRQVHFPTRKRLTGHPFWRFLTGRLQGAERDRWLGQVAHGYERGIELADLRLAEVLQALEEAGRMDDTRMVVTSDHGENLGEHDLVRHDGPPWQTVVRVPLVWWESDGTPVASLPEPLSVTQVHAMVRDGTAPAGGHPVGSMSIRYADPDPVLPFETAVAGWRDDGRKVLWREEHGHVGFTLRSDPAEANPMAATADEVAWMAPQVAAAREAREAVMDRSQDPELAGLLEQLGYVDGTEE